MDIIEEGGARISVPTTRTVSRKLPVFYNPAMRVNRDISVMLLKALGRKNLRVADILAGSGVRSLRFLSESPKGTIAHIMVNDVNPKIKTIWAKNARLSGIRPSAAEVKNTEANIALLSSGGFDYIEIDPFGSPVPFLDAAVKHLARGGILALTATDTAALAGTAPAACRRKYWAQPLRNHLMHEVGLRILVRRAQLQAAQYEKALLPVFAHATLHYDRVYLQYVPGNVDTILKSHEFVSYDKKKQSLAKTKQEGIGPLWTGNLWDGSLCRKMAHTKGLFCEESKRLVSVIAKEAKVNALGFFNLHELASATKTDAPSAEKAMKYLRAKGFLAERTHLTQNGIRTDAPAELVRKLLR